MSKALIRFHITFPLDEETYWRAKKLASETKERQVSFYEFIFKLGLDEFEKHREKLIKKLEEGGINNE